jgi:hypothetical protein
MGKNMNRELVRCFMRGDGSLQVVVIPFTDPKATKRFANKVAELVMKTMGADLLQGFRQINPDGPTRWLDNDYRQGEWSDQDLERLSSGQNETTGCRGTGHQPPRRRRHR